MGTFIALAGVQGLSLALLGLNTSLARKKYKVPGTYDTADAKYSGLYAAQRAHGNQAEWGPAFMVLFLAVYVGEATMYAPTLVNNALVTPTKPVWSQAIAYWATAGRLAAGYALGFTPSLTTASPLRRFAGLSTYLTAIILSCYTIYLGSQM